MHVIAFLFPLFFLCTWVPSFMGVVADKECQLLILILLKLTFSLLSILWHLKSSALRDLSPNHQPPYIYYSHYKTLRIIKRKRENQESLSTPQFSSSPFSSSLHIFLLILYCTHGLLFLYTSGRPHFPTHHRRAVRDSNGGVDGVHRGSGGRPRGSLLCSRRSHARGSFFLF
jgi:hypothetical protein